MNKHLRQICMGLSLLLLLGGKLNLFAQYASGGSPLSLSLVERTQSLRSLRHDDTLHLDAPSKATLSEWLQKDKQKTNELRPFHFAVPITTQIRLGQGQWTQTPNGEHIYRLTIKASGAKSIGLHCSRYIMPEGASLYLYGSQGTLRGAFTAQNNSESHTLSFSPLPGDWVTLEINLPAGISPNQVDLQIDKVYYGYKSFLDLKSTNNSARVSAAGEPLYNYLETGLERLSCAPNIVAYPEYSNQARATLLLIAEGAYSSTGVLINNTRQDGTAYVLTAAHNINRIYDEDFISETPNDPKTIEKVREVCKSIIFFFGFESPSKDQDIRGSEEKTLSGATLIAYDEEHDMALLEITGLPTNAQGIRSIPASYNPYWAGWNISREPQGPFFGIHHALSSTKRICIAEDQKIHLYDYSINKGYEYLNRDISWKQAHWRIEEWRLGTTETGASGSPLFDGNGLVIGALTGGQSNCNNPYRDHYYALTQAWGGEHDTRDNIFKLAPWLNPDNQAVSKLSGYDPYSSKPVQRLSPFYGEKTQGFMKSYQAQEGVSGQGRIITLSHDTDVLGAYIQLGRFSLSQAEKPNYLIELSPIEGGLASSTPIWSTRLNNYNFIRYNRQTGEMKEEERTIGEDEVEVFIPSLTNEKIPAGSYLLSIRTTDDSKLDYPLLTAQYRNTQKDYQQSTWAKSIGSTWSKSNTLGRSLWFDLLIQGDKQNSNGTPNIPNPEQYSAYYYGGQLYIQNPQGEATAQVYDLIGQRYTEVKLTERENIIPTNSLLPRQIYILSIKGTLGSYSIKFRP